MSGVGYGDHGLVDPEGIPGADLDLTVVSSGAGTIKSGGQSMKTVADDLPSKWQRLSAVYESPESEQVFALMDPVTDDVHTIGTVARKVASALETYASAAAEPKRRLDELRVEAAAFVAKVEHGVPRFESAFTPKAEAPVSGSWNGYQPERAEPQSKTVPWYEDVGTRYENDQLIQRINEQVALLQAAQAECALAIKKAAGASVKKAFVAPSESDLDARGVDLPWSRVGTAEGKTWAEQFEDGFTDDLLKTLSGLLHLGGWDDSGEWSWGNLGSAWKGAADGAVAFSLLVDPMAWLDAAVNPKGQAGQTLGAMGDAAQDWWKGAREHPGIAAGAAASAVGTSFLGPEGWAGRTGRAEKILGDLDRAGQRALRSDVEHWLRSGASASDVETLDGLIQRVLRGDLDPAETGSAFDRMFNEEVGAYKAAHPESGLLGPRFDPDSFARTGGVRGVDAAGGHVASRHIINPDTGKHFTPEEIRNSPKPNHTVFSGGVEQVDLLMGDYLEKNRTEIQSWLNGGAPVFDRTMRFDAPIGYGEVDGVWNPEIRALRVVIVRMPGDSTGFRIVSAYPDGTVN